MRCMTDSRKDFNNLAAAGNVDAGGIRPSGGMMTVADDDEKPYAYDMSAKGRVPAQNFNARDPENNEPRDIWLDGETIWVAPEIRISLRLTTCLRRLPFDMM